MESSREYKQLFERLRVLWDAEGYSSSTIRDMEFILGALSDYLDNNGQKNYTSGDGDRFLVYIKDKLKICASRINRAKRIVRMLNRLNQGLDGTEVFKACKEKCFSLPEGLEKSLQAFLKYCELAGNRKTTIKYKRWICGRFLENLAAQGCMSPKDINGKRIQAAFVSLGFTRYWERIRMYLRYLFEEGLVERNYSGLIQIRRHPMPQPVVYTTEEIHRMEESFDLATPCGIRNYAITLLITRYGIRACDIAALTLNNIDFQQDRIHFIQLKTSDPWEAELLPVVKEAIQNYLTKARPRDTKFKNIFLTANPPYVPADYQVINEMIHQQYARAGINVSERKHGSRALRSSIASNMVNDGMPTEVIRSVLGHSTKHALKYYARIDVRSMRVCPLPVPAPTGGFADFLSGKGACADV